MIARALPLLLRVAGALLMVGTLSGSLVVSCDGDPSSGGGGGSGSNAPPSQAMGQWTPATQDTCTKAFHDTFFVIGPDGKKYPSWHAPQETDPATNTQCSFGHEHGLDPRNAALWPDLQQHFARDANSNGTIETSELANSGIPFGYVAEQLANSTTPRIEDHTAYKVTYSNGVPRPGVSGGNQVTGITCDLLAAYNQPTSTADPFASNMFSVTYAVNCNGGTALAVKAIASVMALYRNPGSFTLKNGSELQVNQQPVPPTSPTTTGNELGRRIPTDDVLFPTAFVVTGQTSSLSDLVEQWETQVRLRRADFTEVATFAPVFRVDDPARYYSLTAGALARSVDLCYSGLNSQGALVSDPALATTIVRQVRGLAKCTSIAPNGPSTGLAARIAFDDARSPFRGCSRTALFGAESVPNTGGPSTWYTTPFGERASTVTFANSVKQLVAGNTDSIELAQVPVGQQTVCAGSTVHVPN